MSAHVFLILKFPCCFTIIDEFSKYKNGSKNYTFHYTISFVIKSYTFLHLLFFVNAVQNFASVLSDIKIKIYWI